MAGPVTTDTKRQLEKLRKEREELARIQLAEANAKAAKLKNVSVTVRATTTDGTRLYGSVTQSDILEALEGQGIALDRLQIELAGALREVGQFDVPIKLHAKVSITINVWVVEE